MDQRPLLLQLRLRGKITAPDTPARADVLATAHAIARGEHLILTPEGRAAADIAFVLTGDHADATTTAYTQFLPLNTELIRVCHDWQVRTGGVTNDHRDPSYDWGVIDRLAAIDDRVGPVVRRLGKTVTDFAGYRPQLRAARSRVEDGDHDWFTSPRIDSYHTVWMELHEHLLVGLGLERNGETVDTP